MEFLIDGVLNPEWINELYQRDSNASKIRAYFISGTKIKEDVQCENTNCMLPKRTAHNCDPVTLANVYEPMIFCYFCNRIYHMKCKKLDLQLLSNEETPWTCHECRLNLHNGSAQTFWNKTKFTIPILDRRHSFMRESAISLEQDSFDVDQQFDSQDFEAFKDYFSDLTLSEKFSAQQEIINAKAMARREKEKAQALQNALELEKENHKKQMDQFAQQMQQMQDQLARLSLNQPSTSRAFHHQSPTSIASQNHPLPSQQQSSQVDTASNRTISEKLCDIYTAKTITPPPIEKTSYVYNPSPPPTVQDQRTPTTSLQPNDERLSESTLAQILLRFTESQERNEIRENLAHRRKVMPKMRTFDGDASKWLEFEQDVTRYTKACQYDDETVRWHMKDSLKGVAFESVRDIIDTHPLIDIMETLRSDFGDPMIMIRKKGNLIKDLKVGGVLYREDAVKLRQAIQGYFSACNYAKTGYINSNELGESIYNQFSIEDRARCKELFRSKNPGMSVIICLKTIYEYLVDRMPILDEKPHKKVEKEEKMDDKKQKSFQMFSTSLSSNKKDDSFKYDIRDRDSAPFIGYDLTKVNELDKRCQICGKINHFAVQCSQFRAMTDSQKLNIINDRNLCKNCLLSSDHIAAQCDKKLCCGYRIKNTRCQQKHHIALHNIMSSSNNNENNRPRRHNTNYNTNRVQAIMQNTNQNLQNVGQAENTVTNPQNNELGNNQQQNQPQVNQNAVAFHSIQPRAFNVVPHQAQVIQLQQHMVANHQKTVKMFKTKFIGPNGTTTCFSVGDSGAEITLVRDDLREQLGIKGTPELLSLQWTDNTIKQSMAVKFDLAVQGVLDRSERLILKDCYAINDLNLPFRTLDMKTLKEKYTYLRDVEFDGYYNEQPVMLIGSPHAYVIESIKGLIGGDVGDPVAIESMLGVSVYGGSCENPSSAVVNVQSIATDPVEESPNDSKVTNEELHRLLIEFNSIESLGIKAIESHQTEDDKKAIEILEEEMRVLESGAIEVPLVWNRINKEIPQIDNNYAYAYMRQLALEQKLRKNPKHLRAYNDNVKEMLHLDYMRYADFVDLNTNWKNISHLPMGFAINENKDPPKFRNVYDASSKYHKKSLNDLLLKGPDLLINLVKPLLHMRMNRIAFTADVQHMFHRIHINLRDQQCQRVLFREDHSKPMNTLILKVMAFGPTCSPFVSQFVKNWNADRFATKYPVASKTIKELMYMDDLISSESSVSNAVQTALQCIEICKSIDWNLISFQSNSIEFLNSIPGTHVKKDLIPIMSNENEDYTTKVLGCNWNTTNDCFVYQLDRNIFIKLVTEFEHHPTKRDQASTVARIFDIMGLIAHYTIRGKIMLQRSWKLNLDWDDKIPQDLQKEWRKWLADIENIAKLKIPRMFCNLDSLQQAERIELHVFCDAGAEAFGGVAYFAIHHNGNINTSIVMAKAKVTPLRYKTETEVKEIPRLELFSAIVGSRLANTIIDSYNELDITKYFWTDSEIVLRWIHNPNHRLIKYAIGPIEEILRTTERTDWKYVPTTQNPADICTKFKQFDFADQNSLWFTGPEYLRHSPESWPQLPAKLQVDETAIITTICLGKLNYSTHELPPHDCTFTDDKFINTLSASILASWTKLKRAVARALKLFMDAFIPLVRSKQLHNPNVVKEVKINFENFTTLTSDDLERAEHFLYRKMQKESYAADYKALLNNQYVKDKELQQLNAFMDKQGIIRINARVENDPLYYPQRFVPVLPRKNVLLHVLLEHFHYKYRHIAIESQIAEIRAKTWIPQIRGALKSAKKRCNYCNLANAKPCNPIMAPLPDFRTNASLDPFEVTGLDCLGPLEVKVNGRYKKVYILIFTCTLTRFVHLHVLLSLESLRVMEAIVVFWAAHGPIRKFVSDNGTNFVGASNILKQDYENAQLFLRTQQSILLPKLSEELQLDWQFIPPGSPWMGGVYERLIREVKRSLVDTLKKRALTVVELNIAVQESAHRMNLRPLTHNSIAAEDDIILTPHHLAKHRSGWPLLPGMHREQYVKVNDKLIYRRGRQLADEIMRKFTAYYLPVLTKRCKWFKDEPQLQIGDLVLIINANYTRSAWKRGRVIKLYYGKDMRARVADIQLPDGSIKERCSARLLARIQLSM